MVLLLLLLTAHFIGDFYLQTGAWVECRNKRGMRSASLYKHIAVHTALSAVALFIAEVNIALLLTATAIIASSHWLIDVLKAGRKGTLAFVIDQLAHILVILLVVCWIKAIHWQYISDKASALITTPHLYYVLGYVLIFRPASIFIATVLSRHTNVLIEQENQSLSNAGRWIGYVERLLALSFILVDEYTGLGFLVATKTVFRVGDLSRQRDMRLTEYMMLGTLMSFAIALLVGWTITGLTS